MEQVKKEPDNGQSWFKYAQFLSKYCDEPKKALMAYLKAQDFLPQKDLRFQIGVAYIENNEIIEGILTLQEVVEEKPDYDLWNYLTEIYLEYELIELAKKNSNLIGTHESTNGKTIFLKGKLAELSGQNGIAIKYFKKANALEPNNALYWENLGNALLTNNMIEEALECLHKAILIDSSLYISLLNLAYSNWNLGNVEEADLLYKKLIEQHPDFVSGLYSYFEFQISQNMLEKTTQVRNVMFKLSKSDDVCIFNNELKIWIKNSKMNELKKKAKTNDVPSNSINWEFI